MIFPPKDSNPNNPNPLTPKQPQPLRPLPPNLPNLPNPLPPTPYLYGTLRDTAGATSIGHCTRGSTSQGREADAASPVTIRWSANHLKNERKIYCTNLQICG